METEVNLGQIVNVISGLADKIRIFSVHRLVFNKIIALIILTLVSACSSAKTEKASSTSKVSLSKQNSSSILKNARKNQHRDQLDTCFDDEGNAQVWYKKTLDWQACGFPTQVYQCKGILGTMGEGDGAVVRWALVKVHQGLKQSKSASTAELQAHVLWTAVIASEEIPSAHAERIYSKTKLIPSQIQAIASDNCRSFTTRRIQKARSFNLVDARENEFDESTVDEVKFEYDQKTQQYKIIDQQDEDFEIKVRSH